ncbi:MAG: hypothetical protein AUF65_01590 [Chloroflexi bacterium 13_1_20CM_50_12]|nr:MAG: hypothetical protein AUF65_01590 [Chloroflexi bacterium 13_1_20CM_50_12]
MKYFTQEEMQAFIEQNTPKYPSIKFLGSKQPVNFGGEDHYYAGIWSEGHCVATVNNEAEWNALVKFCFAVVGDVQKRPCCDEGALCDRCATRMMDCEGCGNRYIRASLTKYASVDSIDFLCSDCLLEAMRAHCTEAMLDAMEAEEQAYNSLSEEERIEAKYAAYQENMAVSQMSEDDRRYCEERVYGGYVEF